MGLDDLIWKISEIEEEIREKQLEAEKLRSKLRKLRHEGEGLFKQPASSRVLRQYGVSSYNFKFDKSGFDFQALNCKGNTQIRGVWRVSYGSEEEGSNIEKLTVKLSTYQPSQELEMDCSKSTCSLSLNGNRLSVEDLEDKNIGKLPLEYRTYFEDFLSEVVKEMQEQGRAGSAYQKKVLDIIKDVSCICASFWPWGSLICGPTCAGTLIAYAADP